MELANPPATIEAMHDALDACLGPQALSGGAAGLVKGIDRFKVLRDYAHATWPEEFAHLNDDGEPVFCTCPLPKNANYPACGPKERR